MNTLRKIIFLMTLTILCYSCKEHSTEPLPLDPYEHWHSLNLQNYTIDQKRSCFCPFGGEGVRITVRSDTIARVIRISDTSRVTYPFSITVDSLFGIIRNSQTDSLVVRYNTHYGYPEYVDVNLQLHPVDGGFLYETSNLQIP